MAKTLGTSFAYVAVWWSGRERWEGGREREEGGGKGNVEGGYPAGVISWLLHPLLNFAVG